MFANNPIIVTATPGSFPQGATNTKVVVFVTINGSVYEFHHEAKSNTACTIDISSAFRAELMKTPPTPTPAASPEVQGSITAQGWCVTDSMLDKTTTTVALSANSYGARRGGLTETELLQGISIVELPLTTKPQTGEVINLGDTTQLGSTTVTATTATVTTTTVPDASPSGQSPSATSPSTVGITTASGNTAYVESNPLRHQLLFLNRRGEVESCSVLMRETMSHTINTETFKLSSTTTQQSRRAYHSEGRCKWKMSTGLVERDWREWFINELLMSDYVWLKTTQGYIPVIITPETDTTIYDLTSDTLTSIDFTVTAGIRGMVAL